MQHHYIFYYTFRSELRMNIVVEINTSEHTTGRPDRKSHRKWRELINSRFDGLTWLCLAAAA